MKPSPGKLLSLALAAAGVALFAASAIGMPSDSGRPASGGWETTPDFQKPSEYRQAMRLLKKNDYAGAIPLLLAAKAKSPKDPDILNELGFAYRESGQLGPALENYTQALALDPDHAAAREYLGELYLKENALPLAESQLSELVRICASGCEARGKLEKAIAAYKSAHPAG